MRELSSSGEVDSTDEDASASPSSVASGDSTDASVVDAGTQPNIDGGQAVPRDWQAATPELCSFQINGDVSTQIPTVGVVEWSTDLAGVSRARIEFALNDPLPGELNLGSGGEISTTDGQALMLGLKANRNYTYHLIVESGETVCVSADQRLTTPEAPDYPSFATTLGDASARANGFIVAGAMRPGAPAIIDSDGETVWWFPMNEFCSRAHMDWDGRYMWMMKLNAAAAGAADDGSVKRVRMDGDELEEMAGDEYAHHDFAVAPGGVTAFLWGDPNADNSASFLVERSADGVYTTLARIDGDTLLAGSGEYHANAIRYWAAEDAYTVSDLNQSSIAKFNRQGECIWQVGPGCAPSAQCIDATLTGVHGHQLLPNGNLLYFQVDGGGPAWVHELRFVASGDTFVTEEVWSYSATLEYATFSLGDVQRLSNGNTLITYSERGIIVELAPDDRLVRELHGGELGYTTFRETLYGPPQ